MALCAGLQHSPTIQNTLFQVYCFQLNPSAAESLPMLITHTEQTSAGESGRFFVMEDLLRKEMLLAAVRANAAYDPLSKMIICKIK